jgi:calcium-dependent protein kinase
VDRKAFIEYLQTFRPDKDLEVFGNQLFNAFDANSNGRIDFAEFLVAISFTTNDDPHRKLSFAFKMYDQNHDGQLDVKEIEKIIVGVYDFTGQRNRKGKMTPREVAKSMLRKYDKDESGALTEDEFMSGIADPTLQAMDYFSILRDKMA